MSQSRREDRDSSRRAQENQQRLVADLRSQYDVIICGAGSSGSVVARRLAENPDLRVLLIEAGGSDDAETVLDPHNGRPTWAASGIGDLRRSRTRT